MAFLIPENIPSRSDLPEPLQAVARALRDAADEDVTVWLEGDDPDGRYLLALDPQTGVLALEAPTTSGRGIAQRLSLRENRDDDAWPGLAAARKRVIELSEQIGREARVDHLPVTGAYAIPRLDRAGLKAQGGDPSMCLTSEDFAGSAAIRTGFARVLDTPRSSGLTDIEERVVRGILRPEIIISGAEGDKPEQLVFRPPEVAPDEVIRVLDREQERLARHLGPGYRVIRGVAGSGKTLVLTYRAKYFAEHFPNRGVLMLCYNVVLSKALEQEVKGLPSIRVRTIDSLARSVLNPRGQWGKPQTTEDFAERREQAAEVARRLDSSSKFDVVLVDEAQDLDTAGLELAYAMLKEGRDDFVIALDGAQNIYRKRLTWNPPGMTARGRTNILRVNYRNTREILDFAIRFLTTGDPASLQDTTDGEPDAIIPPEAASRSGPWPKVLTCADQRSEAHLVATEVKRLLDEGVDSRHIAVLFGNHQMQKALYSAFRTHDLPYFCVTFNPQNKRRAVEVSDVRSSTVQGLKGLEFSRVFLCGSNDVWLPDGSEDSVRRLLYVGMTRAMDELTVTVSGSGPIARELAAL